MGGVVNAVTSGIGNVFNDVVSGAEGLVNDVITGVEKRPSNSPTYVLINEVPASNWGYTGNVYVPRT